MEMIKKILMRISPSFRLLVGNKQKMGILLNKIEILEKNIESQALLNRNKLNKIAESLSKNQEEGSFISIICLIYKSTKFAKAVHDSLYEFTPKLKSGQAELLFVANDATPEVIDYLEKEKYNYIVNKNKIISEDALFGLGYGKPEYMSRVYKGYNFGIKNCKGDIVVLINSDNMFSPNWLENLLDKLDRKTIVCSQLVERMHPKFGKFPMAIAGEFGDHPSRFLEEKFLDFAKSASEDKLVLGGAYMPCMTYKINFEKVGYYPEGNIAGKTFEDIIQYGDERLYEKLKKIGVEHVTACDSIVYHFKEGERED